MSAAPGRRAAPILLALACSFLLLAAAFWQTTIRSDLLDFLPRGSTAATQAMLTEMRQGSAADLLLVSLEGAPKPELARISAAMQQTLASDVLFSRVAGGDAAWNEEEEAQLFAHRYLLSPIIEAGLFTTEALRGSLQELLRNLHSSAAPLVARYGLPDPVGAFPAWLARLGAAGGLEAYDGAWFVAGRDPPRAVLLVMTTRGSADLSVQEAATAAITQAFAAARPGGARLLLAGPVVMARDAARSIRADVDRIAIISTVLVVGLLAWRFRSMLVLAALAVPTVLSIAVGVWLTGLFFGAVHAIALGFGITMLGITLDYPVLLIGHRKHGEAAPETLARIGRAFRLAVAVAVLGLAGLVFSGFPGLAQLGVLASTGLLAAAAATWWLLPPLVVAANLAPVAAGSSRWVVLVEGARRYRGVAIGLAGLAACGLVAAGGPRWETDLAALSPVPAVSRALDAELRTAVGAAEAGQFVLVQRPDADAVLRAQEALLPTLDRLVQQGVIGGYEAAAALLPSLQRQRRNQAALPSPEVLTARLAAAAAGLPFRPGSFQPFLDAIAEARTQQPWSPAEIAGSALAMRLEPLLRQRDDAWLGPIRFRSVTDTALLRAALEGTGEVFVDVRTELEGILDGFRARAGWLLGGTGLVMLLALWAGLRQPARVLRVVGAVVAAQAVTLALLTSAGVRLSSIHLASLLLVAGVGLDYALFMAREGLDIEERARTLRTLITCNAMTLLTFGLLATCATPILHDIGVTIVLGAALSLGYAMLVAAPPRHAA